MKLKHLLPVLLAGSCLAETETLANAEAVAAPSADAAADAAEAKMMEATLNDFARAVASSCVLMESVTDRASADAVADKIHTRRQMIGEYIFALDYIPADKIDKALAAHSVSEERFAKAMTALREKRFYGSLALAAACGGTPLDVMEKAETTPEIIAKIGQQLMADVEGKIYGISGGPGLTEETAWKMGNDSVNLSYISTIMESIPRAQKLDEKMVYTAEEGPIYARFVFMAPYEGKVYELQMWFDVTEIVNAQNTEEAPIEEEDTEEVVVEEEDEAPATVLDEDEIEEIVQPADQPQIEEWVEYTPEQKKEAVEIYVDFSETMHMILCSVKDTASADSAAPMVKQLVENAKSIEPIFPQISQMDVIEKLEERNISPNKLKEEFNRVLENDFYNSEQLRNAFDN